MQIILLESIPHVGQLGDVVKVKDGFARNYLIPTKKAKRATAAAIEEFKAHKAELERAQAERLAKAEELKGKIDGLTITIASKAGVDGRLFGSVTNMDVAEALEKLGYDIHKSQVRTPLGAIKAVGEYPLQIDLHHEIVANVNVQVVAEASLGKKFLKTSVFKMPLRNVTFLGGFFFSCLCSFSYSFLICFWKKGSS